MSSTQSPSTNLPAQTTVPNQLLAQSQTLSHSDTHSDIPAVVTLKRRVAALELENAQLISKVVKKP
ncbi:hypothetical protein JVT61DRAFT_116 [Boletus reticuloceps]|uniref:Uncharacterized protein n=1 Tax=Boletus reticuloceps TaxID=495285 RepID=A0A8I2YY67_9AGAM|nr:hypothetical protein JVT61DRAFT_116 [Boletus reticuloceps]